jgi:hypothetical protein
MKKHQDNNPFTNLNGFVEGLKHEDKRNWRMTRNVKWLMWLLAPLYAALFLLNPSKDILLTERIGGLCYALGFVLFALILQKFNREFKSVDYGVPVIEMLTQVTKRYNLFWRKIRLIVFPVLLIDAGMVLVLLNRFGSKTTFEVIVWVQMVLIPSLAIGASIGLFIWYKRQKPLRDAALAMLDELEQ